jgi:hypothetical protein
MTFIHEVDLKIDDALLRIRKTPIAALIWGTAPTSSDIFAETRLALREALVAEGHLARFSEDLLKSASGYSTLAQQVAQVEAHDVVFSIPASPGSIAEIHDFARMPGISHKIVTFVNRDWNHGYANQSLLQLRSTLTPEIQPYDPSQLPACVVDSALAFVHTLQEWFYFAGRRC